MAKTLFTKNELEEFQKELSDLETKHNKNSIPWREYWEQREAIQRAHLIKKVGRVQERAEEFLNALIILVGYQGERYIDFEHAFAVSDVPELKELLTTHDTPENRRALYTILRALTEIPKTWATSAFVRFLRGTGKQKGAKYHGAGMLGTDYGWKTKNITAICGIITGNNSPYSQVLMSYADVEEEIHEEDPDFEVHDHDVTFKATRVERDIEFLNQLCDMLEQRGLADIPKAREKGPKKERKVKVFKPGDKIRKGTIRDLPLPAHVRIDIDKHDKASDQWVEAQLDWVVVALGQGYFRCLYIGKDGKAYQPHIFNDKRKELLEGATFVGSWEGESTKKELEIKFKYRPRGKSHGYY